MSNTTNDVVGAYQDAVRKIEAGTATFQDELVVALWDKVQDLEQIVVAQNYKLAVLETREQCEVDKQEIYTEARKAITKVRYLH